MAYQKKIPVDLDCPLRLTMSLIESKWKSCILDELRDGTPLRPNEIHKRLPEAAPRVLDIQLKEMVADGLIEKTIYPELPPKSEYHISELGISLLPIIDMMLKWGSNIWICLKENTKPHKKSCLGGCLIFPNPYQRDLIDTLFPGNVFNSLNLSNFAV